MIDTDKYGMTNEELLERYSNLSVDDYKELLAEVKRMRAVFDSHGECHLCGFRLDEHYSDHELPCKHVEVIE